MFKDDLWGALEEYPEARKNLLEKGRQMLMKVKLQYLSHADEGEGWFSSILIIFYQEKMKKKLKVSNVCQTKAKQINFGFGKLWHIFFLPFLSFHSFSFPFLYYKTRVSMESTAILYMWALKCSFVRRNMKSFVLNWRKCQDPRWRCSNSKLQVHWTGWTTPQLNHS